MASADGSGQEGSGESVASPATAAVVNVNDLPGGSVTLDNTTPSQGDTLTAANSLVRSLDDERIRGQLSLWTGPTAAALVTAAVGAVGLLATLSMAVFERQREIGVMRAIGASSWQVIRLFIGEGLLLGLLSWMIALPLSIPTAYAFTTQGLSLALNQQLVYQFTPTGAGLWLVIITMLAIFASALPARGASRISVRESLSYS